MLGIPIDIDGCVSLDQQTGNQVDIHPMSARIRTLRNIILNQLKGISMEKGFYVARLELMTCRFSSVSFEDTSQSNR